MEIKSREELDQDWIDNYFNNINNNIFSFIEPIKEITIFFIYINNNETEYFFKSFLNIDKFISKASLFKLIEERKEARKKKDWVESDQIRDKLKEKGILLEDTSEGVRWKRVK